MVRVMCGSQESEMPAYVVIFGQWIVLLFRITWVKMPEAMLSVSAKLIRMLNLAYCMSLSDSSFGPEGQKRELLDLRKRGSARGTQRLFSVKYVFGEANIA